MMKKILFLLASTFLTSCNSEIGLDVNSILNSKNRDEVVYEVYEYISSKSINKKLNESQRVVLLIENMQMEINNGGFSQFYLNSTGNYAHETFEALKEIGAIKASEVIRKANSEFPQGKVPKDRNTRFNLTVNISKKSQEKWNNLSNHIYGINRGTGELYIENLNTLLFEFIKNNKIKIGE